MPEGCECSGRPGHPGHPFRSQSCPRLHSCFLSIPPRTLATGQFPTLPPAPLRDSVPSHRAVTASERQARAVPAPRSMLGAGRRARVSVSPPLKGWGKGRAGAQGLSCGMGGLALHRGCAPTHRSCPHELLNPQPCPSLGEGGGRGPRTRLWGPPSLCLDRWGNQGQLWAPSGRSLLVLSE